MSPFSPLKKFFHDDRDLNNNQILRRMSLNENSKSISFVDSQEKAEITKKQEDRDVSQKKESSLILRQNDVAPEQAAKNLVTQQSNSNKSSAQFGYKSQYNEERPHEGDSSEQHSVVKQYHHLVEAVSFGEQQQETIKAQLSRLDQLQEDQNKSLSGESVLLKLSYEVNLSAQSEEGKMSPQIQGQASDCSPLFPQMKSKSRPSFQPESIDVLMKQQEVDEDVEESKSPAVQSHQSFEAEARDLSSEPGQNSGHESGEGRVHNYEESKNEDQGHERIEPLEPSENKDANELNSYFSLIPPRRIQSAQLECKNDDEFDYDLSLLDSSEFGGDRPQDQPSLQQDTYSLKANQNYLVNVSRSNFHPGDMARLLRDPGSVRMDRVPSKETRK